MAWGKNKQKEKLLALADQYEGNIGQAFIQGINNIRSKYVLKEISDLIESRHYYDAIHVVTDTLVKQGMVEMAGALTAAFTAGGMVGQEFLAGSKIDFHFNIVNPNTAQLLDSYKTTLVKQVSQDVKNTLSEIMRYSISVGDNPLTTARAMRDSIGLTGAQARWVLNYRNELSGQIPQSGALARVLRDRRSDTVIQNAIENRVKLPAEKIDSLVSRYEQRVINMRANTIARTESIRLVNEGNRDTFDQAIEDGVIQQDQIRRYWIYTHDNKVRDSHASLGDDYPDGVGQDEPFITINGEQLMYPGDPSADPSETINCRCTVFTEIIPA